MTTTKLWRDFRFVKQGFLLGLFLSVGALARAGDEPVLMIHYTCDSLPGGTARDASGHGLDASTYNVDLAEGVSGMAYSTQGEGWLALPDDPQIPLGESFTISYWLKVQDIGERFSNIVKKHGKVRNCVIFLTKAGTPIWSAGYEGSAEEVDNITIPAVVDDGAWHHMIFVQDGSVKKLYAYVDGKLIKEAELPSGSLKSNEAPLLFMDGVIGEIDEIKVYRGALSPEAVKKESAAYTVPAVPDPAQPSSLLPPGHEITGWTDVSYTQPVTPDMVVEDLDAAIEQAQAGIEQCRERIAQLDTQGIWTGYEQLSLSIAEKFIDYALSDQKNIDKNAAVFLRWGWRGFTREHAVAFAERIPYQEMRQVLDIVERVEATLADEELLKSRPHPPVAQMDSQQFVLDGSYFKQDGHVVFPHGFNKVNRDSEVLLLSKWDVGQVDIPFKFNEVFPDGPGEVNEEAVDRGVALAEECLRMGLIPNIRFAFILPDWVEEQYPEVVEVGGQFMPLDIDHPVVRGMTSRILEVVLEKMPHAWPVLYKIGNEISYPLPVKTTLGDDWQIKTPSVSKYGWAKYAKYLQQEYLNIDALNKRWGKNYADFDEAAHAPINKANAAAFYDACRFNEIRVLDYYQEQYDQIKRTHPEALVHLNIANGKLMSGSLIESTYINGKTRGVSDYLCGVWVEQFNKMTDIVAFDTAAMRLPPQKYLHPKYLREDYAFEWLGLAMIYDYQRSISNGKLMHENELHAQQTVGNRDDRMPPEHLRCVQWIQFALGMGMNRIWLWSRNGDELEYDHARAMYCSISMFPLMVDAYLGTSMELNAVAPEITAIAQAPKPVAILFSDASAMQDVGYLDTQMATYEALCFLGQGIDFVTETQVQNGALDKYALLVVGGARNVEASTRAAVEDFLDNGGELIRVGEGTLDRDPWGKFYPEPFEGGETLAFDTVAELHGYFQEELAAMELEPGLQVIKVGQPDTMGLFHRSVEKDGVRYLFVAQIGAEPVPVEVLDRGQALASAYDVLTGQQEDLSGLTLQPWEVRLWKIE